MTTASTTEAALAPWADGIIDVGLGRRPGPDDWLVLALGDDRLVPVRTHPSVLPERLGLVVYADRPPSNRALVLLAQVAAGDVAGLSDTDASRDDVGWVLDAVVRVAAAL